MIRFISHRSLDRRGTSLVEMLVVLVLGGLLTTAAVSLIGPTNEVAREATESAEVEEGARSAVDLAASHIRRVPLGGVQVATRDSVVIALPIGMGVFCSNTGNSVSVYLGLAGRALPIATLDGYAFRDANGAWAYTVMAGPTMFSGATTGRAPCVAQGGGVAGVDTDYYTFNTSTSNIVGSGFLVWDRTTLRFGPSVLDPRTRGFHYGATGGPLLEVAFELHTSSRFEYRLRGASTWYASLTTGQAAQVDAIRVVAGSMYESTNSLLAREVQLMNSE